MNTELEIRIRLKCARKASGFKKAKDFVSMLEMPASTYSQYENGKRSLSIELLCLFAKKLEISVAWLLTGKGHPCPHADNKSEKKHLIYKELEKFDEVCISSDTELSTISYNDLPATVDLKTLSFIISEIFSSIFKKINIEIDSEELINFIFDTYNSLVPLYKEDAETRANLIRLLAESFTSGRFDKEVKEKNYAT